VTYFSSPSQGWLVLQGPVPWAEELAPVARVLASREAEDGLSGARAPLPAQAAGPLGALVPAAQGRRAEEAHLGPPS
jgi:hypothetical protein